MPIDTILKIKIGKCKQVGNNFEEQIKENDELLLAKIIKYENKTSIQAEHW